MESLGKLGDVVKAMEFIGQSSGKASKGQSQKVQQAVLQKFRAGGYNTIVATSIGEEGLDIMEVDLVICFDANVSPIRMIQRMGRTGRKRDGRVAILASEGSELQGYLKKQAKGKALGKHMHNGGINSFNFHCSPRMVPHSYQPEVQFVEMSIEKFVPRGRKSRADALPADKEDDELTESEKNLLAKYFGSGTEEAWKPSLVAFPHYQLFPSRVYKVRHSFKTTEMLIDTLQFLQEYRTSLTCSNTSFLRTEVGVSSAECLPSVLDITTEAGSQGVKSDSNEPADLVSEEHHIQLCTPSMQSGKVVSDLQQTSQEVKASYRFCEVDESLAKHKSLSDEALKHKSSDSTVQDKEASLNISSSCKTSLHRCLYNTGFVSVNQEGRVIILSPPTLPLLNKLSSAVTFMNGNNSVEVSSEKPVSPTLKIGNSEHVECMTSNPSMKEKVSSEMVNVSTTPEQIIAKPIVSHEQMTPKQIKVCSPTNSLIKVIDSIERVNISTPHRDGMNVNPYDAGADVQMPPYIGRLFEMPKEVVLETPDSCFRNFRHDFKGNFFRPLSTNDAGCVDLSPHMTNLAVRDIVPESPIAKTNSLQHPISNLDLNKTGSYCKSPACGIITSSWDEHVTYLRKKGVNDYAGYTNTEICKTPRENRIVISADVSPTMVKSNNFKMKSLTAQNWLPDNAEQLNFECLSISKPSAVKEKSTPLVTQMNNSCSEDWHLSTAETEKSIQRQCKFKRLCKRKDASQAEVSASPSPCQIPYTRTKNHGTSNDSIRKKSRLEKEKRHSKISARLFIDEEAEVSSADDLSTDDNDECDNNSEGESESDSFIDDRVEPTAGSTQSEGDPVDIMAVYRRSLFTQSPLAEELNPWAHSCQAQDYDGSGSSDPSGSANASVDNNIGSHTRSLATSFVPTLIQDTHTKTSSSMGHYNAVEESRIVDVKPSSSEERHNKMESRKRKLSFLQVDSTGKSNFLENHVPPFAVANSGENFNSSSSKENEPNESMGRTFDDDLFEGLDLDALEAEATEMARLRSNMNAGAEQMTCLAKSCLPNTHALDLRSSVKPVSLNNATDIKQSSRILVETCVVDNCINRKVNMKDHKFAEGSNEKNRESRNDLDLDFLCTPSFDLGI